MMLLKVAGLICSVGKKSILTHLQFRRTYLFGPHSLSLGWLFIVCYSIGFVVCWNGLSYFEDSVSHIGGRGFGISARTNSAPKNPGKRAVSIMVRWSTLPSELAGPSHLLFYVLFIFCMGFLLLNIPHLDDSACSKHVYHANFFCEIEPWEQFHKEF